MDQYEYKVVPSPRRTKRVKGAKTSQDRFAHTLTELMNGFAAEGWEYLRAETLPMEEKKGMLASATESYQSVLVFRRAIASKAAPRTAQVEKPEGTRAPISLGPAERTES